jgi:hypothetical protein
MFGSFNPAQWLRMTGSALVKKATGLCTITGILCTESSSLVINIYDGIDNTGTKVVGPLTLTASNPYPIPAKLNTGLYIEFASGSGSLTVFYD